MENQDTPKRGYVFLGNSLTEGFDLEVYFPEWPAINRGIAADHIDGLLQRLDISALDLDPAKLFLMIGINDIGDRRSDEYLQEMFTILLKELQRGLRNTDFYVCSLLPASARWTNCPPQQIVTINAFLKELAAAKGMKFIDLHPLFLDENGYLRADLSTDGLHLNAQGYQIWAEQLHDCIDQEKL